MAAFFSFFDSETVMVSATSSRIEVKNKIELLTNHYYNFVPVPDSTVWDLKKDEVEGYFDEIHACGLNCKFLDCTHTYEEKCAVIEALDKGEISPMRYESYQALMESVSEEHLRR